MNATAAVADFRVHFSEVDDPRIKRSKLHELMDILFISVAATIAGADGPTEIADFAKEQIAWCRKFVRLSHGVPSHDTIGRVLALIKPEQFQEAFLKWIASFASGEDSAEGLSFVPIDGKTVRGSDSGKARSHPLHLVSAWATKQGMTLGQVAVDSKSNEITAIPKLLQMLELSGAIISIDAMGCQKEIARMIIDGGGDYVLAVKHNQPKLYEAIETFYMKRHENNDFRDFGCRQRTTVERSRGRDETRYYSIAPVPASMKHFCRSWKGMRAIGQVITHTKCGGKETSEVRYYITSRSAQVKEFSTAVRGHWLIESMHWILDVVFDEDASRISNGNGTENFSLLRKFAVSLLKRDKSKGSLKGKRKRAGWSTRFLQNVLFSQGI